MSEPIVFISHFTVKEGKLDGLKQHAQMMNDDRTHQCRETRYSCFSPIPQ